MWAYNLRLAHTKLHWREPRSARLLPDSGGAHVRRAEGLTMLRMDSIQIRITKWEGASCSFCIPQHVYKDQAASAGHSSRTPLKIGEINVDNFD